MLVIAEQIAQAKWDDGAAAEDTPREAQVIMGAVKDGESRGTNPISACSIARSGLTAPVNVTEA